MTEGSEILNGGLTVKERLQRIEDGVLRIETAVVTKAEQQDVQELRDRVAALETRLAIYEERAIRAGQDVVDARAAVVELKEGQTDIYKAIKWATGTIIGILTLGDIIIRFFAH